MKLITGSRRKCNPDLDIECTGDYFDVMGIKPYFGRFFGRSDERGPDSAPYVVLSYPYWKTQFQGDRNVVGRTVEINRHAFTIIGVAPPQFHGVEMFFWPDLWTPLVEQTEIEGSNTLEQRYWRDLFLIGRLKSDGTLVQAQADLNSVAETLKKTYPTDDDGMLFNDAVPGVPVRHDDLRALDALRIVPSPSSVHLDVVVPTLARAPLRVSEAPTDDFERLNVKKCFEFSLERMKMRWNMVSRQDSTPTANGTEAEIWSEILEKSVD